MNYQQWQPLETAPIGRRVTVNTGGYIFPGKFFYDLQFGTAKFKFCGPYGRIYDSHEIQTWSWSDTEPAAENLMVKPHGIFCAHWWNEVGHLLNIIQAFDIRLFVELGILDGGLASILIDRSRWSPDFWYLGVDLPEQFLTCTDRRVVAECLIAEPDKSTTGNPVFLTANVWDMQTIDVVAVRIWDHPNKRALVYCDGGDKKREAHLYWPILRPGDLLGVHDYSDDPNSKGPEVYYNDVSDIIRVGKRLGQDDLKETRILLVEKI